MAFEAMERSQEKSYDKFVQIASHFYKVIDRARKMRDDLKIFILTHAENIGTPEAPSYKMKTVGKHFACIALNSGKPKHIMCMVILSQAF